MKEDGAEIKANFGAAPFRYDVRKRLSYETRWINIHRKKDLQLRREPATTGLNPFGNPPIRDGNSRQAAPIHNPISHPLLYTIIQADANGSDSVENLIGLDS